MSIVFGKPFCPKVGLGLLTLLPFAEHTLFLRFSPALFTQTIKLCDILLRQFIGTDEVEEDFYLLGPVWLFPFCLVDDDFVHEFP